MSEDFKVKAELSLAFSCIHNPPEATSGAASAPVAKLVAILNLSFYEERCHLR